MAKKNLKPINRIKVCPICKDHLLVDYKNTMLLEKFITDSGKIIPRRFMKVCSKHQRKITREIKKARHMALLPFVIDISN